MMNRFHRPRYRILIGVLLAVLTLAFGCSGDEVSRMIDQLGAKETRDRMKAAVRLGELGDERAVEPLTAAVSDKAPEVRREAIKALGRMKARSAAGAILKVMKGDEFLVQRAAAGALIKIGDPGVADELLPLLNEDGSVGSAAMVLGELGDKRAVGPLLKFLARKGDRVDDEVVVALGKLGDPRAIKPLLKFGDRKYANDYLLRGKVTSALGRFGAQATPPLAAMLKDKNAYTRTFAAEALGRARDPKAVKPLLRALKDKNHYVIGWAAWALGRIADPQTLPVLLKTLKKDKAARKIAIGALAWFESPEALDYVIQGTRDEDYQIRNAAVKGLAEKVDPRFIPVLIEALADDTSDTREAAEEGLRQFGSRVVEDLIKALDHEKPEVRRQTAAMLRDYEDARLEPALIRALDQEDVWVLAGDPWFFIKLGREGSEDLLIRALNETGSKDMAQAMLNCGNGVLETASRTWFKKHGYQIRMKMVPGGSGRRAWGSK